MDLAHHGNRLLRRAFFPAFILALNVWICWRLFFTDYLNQMGSIEGAFIALDHYIRYHWPLYNWFPVWYAGMPFTRVYQPGLHYVVAVFSAASGLGSARSYHFVTALTYSLGAVAFYYLARVLSGSRVTAFCAALFFSCFSPSALLIPVIRHDMGGLLNARRLQAMVAYGEGPNVTGLGLCMLALAFLHRAVVHKTLRSGLLAAVVIAAVPATSWPATMVLAMGFLAYLVALPFRGFASSAPRVIAIGVTGCALALPFALPSTVWSTLLNANVIGDGPTRGAARFVFIALMLLAMFATRVICMRAGADFGLRFALQFLVITAWIVLCSSWGNLRLIPQPVRFHLAMEIAFVLTAALVAQSVCRHRPRVRRLLLVAVAVFTAFQSWHYRHNARSLIRSIDIARTVEYQEAARFASDARSRVLAPGSVSFWMNAFSDTPQMVGCCEQSVVNPENFIAAYITMAGYNSARESADFSLLWMKAYAVDEFAAAGPKTREYYHAFAFPDRFGDSLPVVWRNGDDYIYRLPSRAPGLARVVRSADLVTKRPENGIDVAQLRPFVAALDNPALPAAHFEWRGSDAAVVTGAFQPDSVVEIAVNYEKGWSASVNGNRVPLRPDGLGFIVVEPRCNGSCEVHLAWSLGPEPWIAIAISALTLLGGIAMAVKEKRGSS